ncbi:MAG: oligosaccharide flippase family protein [Pseudomonadota bacterium]
MAKTSTWTALRNVSWAGLEAVSSVLVSFVAMLGIARLIGASEFGLGALAIGITQIPGVILGSLFHDALVRNPGIGRRQFDSAWTATLALSAVVTLVCVLLAEPLADFFREPRFAVVFVVMALILIPDSAIATFTAERRRELDFRLVTLQFVIARIVGALAGVLCAVGGLGVWSMVVQQWLTTIIGLSILFAKSPYRPRFLLVLDDLWPMVRFTISIIATQFVIQIAQRLMLIYVARIGDLTLAGYWGLADRLVDAIQRTVTNALYHVSLSHFSKVQDDKVKLGSLVREANAWLASFVFPGMILIAVTGPEIIDVLLGQDWVPAGLPVQVLAIGMIIQLRRLMDHVALNALGRSDIAFKAYALEATLALSALFLLQPTTLLGIAIIRALQPAAGYGLIAYQSRRQTGRSGWLDVADVGRDLLLILLVGVAVWWLHQEFGIMFGGLPQLVASGLAAVAATLGAIALIRPALFVTAWSFLRRKHAAKKDATGEAAAEN